MPFFYLIIAILFGCDTAFGFSGPFTRPHVNSISTNGGAFGNPAGLSDKSGAFGSLRLDLEENKSFERLQLDIKSSQFALGYEYQSEDYSGKLALAHSIFFGNNFSLGLNYDYSDWAGGSGFGFNYGLQWEPFSWIKAGYFTQNLWQSHSGKKAAMTQQYGVGLRPLSVVGQYTWGHQFTLYYEGIISGFSQNSWEDQSNVLGAQAEFLPGIHVNGQFDLDEPANFSLGFYIQTSPNDFLGYLQSESKGKGARNQYILQLHSHIKQSSISQQGKVAVLDLNTKIEDGYGVPSWIFGQDELGHLDIIKQINLLANTPGIKTIFLKTGRTHCSFAVASEIRQALFQAKKQGLKIAAYMETTSKLSYYLATSANFIAMPPSSYFDVQGFSSEVLLFKNFLAKLGVEPQFIRHGKYKSYPEMFTSDSLSPEYGENIKSLLAESHNNFLKEISHARGINMDSLTALFNSPELSIKAAIERNLLDSAMYMHEMSKLEMLKFPKFKVKLRGAEKYDESWSSPPAFAVLRIEGTILEGGNGNGSPLTGEIAGSESICKKIKLAKENPEIRGLLLRLNSGGGSAIASDIIYQELLNFKNSGKPLVVSVGNVCASGCYYIASAGDMILGGENSIVGSIGIFGGKFVVKNTLEKLGIGHNTINSSKHADAKSMLRHWDEEEVKAIRGFMDDFYQRFINVVNLSRKVGKDSLKNLAEGRVFLGSQAIQNGLLDRIGGFEESLSALKLKIGLTPGSHVKLISLEHANPVFQGSKTFLSAGIKEDISGWLQDQKRLTEGPKIWAFWPGLPGKSSLPWM